MPTVGLSWLSWGPMMQARCCIREVEISLSYHHCLPGLALVKRSSQGVDELSEVYPCTRNTAFPSPCQVTLSVVLLFKKYYVSPWKAIINKLIIALLFFPPTDKILVYIFTLMSLRKPCISAQNSVFLWEK